MPLLDRYIARQYFINVVTLLVILFSFVVAIDVSLNIDRFSNLAREAAEQHGMGDGLLTQIRMTVFLIGDLWWPRLLQLYNFVIGLVLVGAMGFTISQLVRNREILAMLAAGQSLHRIARPVLAVAVFMLGLSALNQETLIPKIAPLLARQHAEAGVRGLGVATVPLTDDGAGRHFRAQTFDIDEGVLEGVWILERKERQAVRTITADRAIWHDGGWDLENGLAQTVGLAAAGETDRTTTEPVERVETSLDPTRLKMDRYREFRNALSFGQVGEMLARPELIDAATRRELERVRWGRISMLVSPAMALMIALPFFATREPRNMVVQSLKCAPVSILALMGGVLGASAAIPGLPPAVGVFIPVMILAAVAIASMSGVRT